ncbi:MAG: hypothetical protein AAF581_17100 [Planctomycetota bacterium]
MTTVDWLLFAGFLAYVVWDGTRQAKKNHGADDYFLAGRSMPWWAIGLSIMATQASAITMIGTTGKGWSDGLGFVQFYFALPIAMFILAFTLVPLYHRLRVSTAYEYLGVRFDAKTRIASAAVFVALRSLSLAIVIYAPSVLLTHLIGTDPQWTIIAMGGIALVYTTLGGLRAVIATDVKQMTVMCIGLVVAFVTIALRLPDDVGLAGAWELAGAAGRLEWIDLSWDPSRRYTLWSSLLGGTLLFLAYFGCDQSQAQRLLASRSVSSARRALLLNAVAKVPFQFLVLSCGVLLFGFYLFAPMPVSFVPNAKTAPPAATEQEFQRLVTAHEHATSTARSLARDYLAAPEVTRATRAEEFRTSLAEAEEIRSTAKELRDWPKNSDHAFPYFILTYFPMGLAGILLAAIFAAALSSIDSELNAVSTVLVLDVLQVPKRYNDDARTLQVARRTTAVVGIAATAIALFLGGRDSVIDAVNLVGSYFYGSLLGVFVLAVAMPRANGTGAVAGLFSGVLAIALAHGWTWYNESELGFLYFNTISTTATIIVGATVSVFTAGSPPGPEVSESGELGSGRSESGRSQSGEPDTESA